MKKFILLLLCITALNLNAQTEKDQQFWDNYILEKTAEWTAEKAEARTLNQGSGFPLRTELDDGTVLELMKFKNGRPFYYKTMNIDAAKTSATDQVWPGDHYLFDLTGSDVTLGIWDGGAVRTRHVEFRDDRATQMDGLSLFSSHATHVAGTMIAEGYLDAAKGMSHEAELHCYEWNNDESEMANAYTDGLRASNHSYGFVTGWQWNARNDNLWAWYGDYTISETEDFFFGFYSFAAEEMDEFIYDAPYYLHMRAAGNDRNDVPSVQPTTHWIYDGSEWVLSDTERDKDGGTDGFDCISHHGLAKNIITVGAVNSLPNGYSDPSDVVATSFSSWGPCDDGRIKPDISADGNYLYSCVSSSNISYGYKSGTSMACPTVSGSIGLLFQLHNDLGYSGEYLASTWKAILLHTAYEAGSNDGPDYSFGWGLLNTLGASQFITENYHEGDDFYIREETLQNNETYEIQAYSDGETPIKVTICWTDPEGTAVSYQLNPRDVMLVNDLDIIIEDANSDLHYPWVLDVDNPSDAATTGDNDVDNVEQVYISSPVEGIVTISVTHEGDLMGDGNEQTFSMCISGLTPTEKPKLSYPEVMQKNVEIPLDFDWYDLANAGSYHLQVSTTPAFDPDDLVVDETGLTASTWEATDSYLESETEYWWRVRAYIDGDYSDWSAMRGFKTERLIELCDAGSNECDEYIYVVDIGSIYNVSGCSDDNNGYSDYMDQSTEVIREYTHPMVITNGVYYTGDQCGVWVDWNQDNDFTDDGEEMTVSGGPANFYANISVPDDALLGKTPMRIRILYNDDPEPCGYADYGEVEDYMLNVLETTDYCQSGSYNCSEFISRVQINDIDNSSSCSVTDYNYSDFSSLTTDYEAGTATMTVTGGNVDDDDVLGVWVDWNEDLDFDDLREEQEVTRSGNTFTVTIQNPAVVLLGQKRMRIKLQRGGTPEPCGLTQYGEVEDYTLNVVEPAEPLDPPQLTSPENNSTDVPLNPLFVFESVEDADEYYIEVSKESDFSDLLIEYVSTNTRLKFLGFLQDTETEHYWRVRAQNDQTESEWSEEWAFTTDKYCGAYGSNSDYIRNVSLLSIDNVSGNERYGDFRDLSTDINVGITSDISIETISYDSYCNIWVDWNQDADFLDANEEYITYRSGTTFNGEIIPPWNALTGETRMRIRLGSSVVQSSCGGSANGEVEDYTLNVNFMMVDAPDLLSPANNEDDVFTNVDFSWSEVEGAQWYEIEVALDDAFNNIIYSEQVYSPSYSVEGLDNYTDHWWRVKAANQEYESSWSEFFKFKTEAADVPNSWDHATNTGSSAEIIVPADVDPVIGERDFIPGDAVGAFFMDEDQRVCGGYGVWDGSDLTFTVWGDNPLTGEKDGFDEDESFIIRIWDAIEGRDYAVNVSFRDGDPDYFTPDGESYIDFLEANFGAGQFIDLISGWNIISSYIDPADDDVEDIFDGIENNMLIAKKNNGDMYFPSLGVNTIGTWDFHEGYKLYMTMADQLYVQGTQLVPEDNPIPLNTGWNMIPYLRDSEYSVADITDQLGENMLIIKNNDGDMYFPSLGVNTLGNMVPGQGYVTYMINEDELTYPSNSSPRITVLKDALTPKAKNHIPEFSGTGRNSSLLIDMNSAYNGNEVCVFDSEDNIIGSGIVHNGIAAVSIWGDNENTKTKDGAALGERLTSMMFDAGMKRWQKLDLTDMKELTSNKNIDVLSFTDNEVITAKASIIEFTDKDKTIKIMPNPAGNHVMLEIWLQESSPVSYEIYDQKGELMVSSYLGDQNSGKVTQEIDLSRLSSGNYQFIVIINGNKYSSKLVVIR